MSHNSVAQLKCDTAQFHEPPISSLYHRVKMNLDSVTAEAADHI